MVAGWQTRDSTPPRLSAKRKILADQGFPPAQAFGEEEYFEVFEKSPPLFLTAVPVDSRITLRVLYFSIVFYLYA
jgi:hypothetical protein